MLAIAGLDMVSLEMQRDVAKDDRVAIDIERSKGRARLIASFFHRLQLANKVLREVGGCYRIC